MKKLLIMGLALVGTLALTGAAGASSADILQPASTITYNEEVVVNSTLRTDSIVIGSSAADVGGVTFFNGSIVNNSVDADGASTIPVTFADDVRIDGRVWRGATAGTDVGDSMPFIINDNAEVVGTLTIGSLGGTGVVNSTNIADGTIATADLAGSTVTSAKIANGTIVGADLASDAVTPEKINGEGGANLPIAYGIMSMLGSDASLVTGTTNISNVVKDGYFYRISIDGMNWSLYDYPIMLTSTDAQITTLEYTSDQDGNFIVLPRDDAGLPMEGDFSFVVYPDPSAN